MGIDQDPKDKAVKVVRVQSYEKGIDQEKGIVLPEQLHPDRSADENKKFLNDQVRRVVNCILMDREVVLQEIMVEQDKLVRENARVVLDDPASQVAVFLAAHWRKESIDLPDVSLYEGVCGYEQHTWFRAFMDARQVGEPDYFYVIDPWGRGVSVISLSGQESDMVVLKPWSPFHVVYAGKPILSLGLAAEEEGGEGSGE